MKEQLIVKYGSNCVADELGVNQVAIDGYVDQLIKLSYYYDLSVVTSGAIAVGRTEMQEL